MRVILKNENEIKSNTPTTIIVDREGYKKPIDGIPATDIASGVIPSNISSLNNDVGYYIKPNTGVPESDLSQGVKDKMNEKEVFWAEYGVTTFADVISAIRAGKLPIVKYNALLYTYTKTEASQIIFVSVTSFIIYRAMVKTDDTWYTNNYTCEVQSNRKNTIVGSESSNTSYPTTKAVADALAPKAGIGDVLFANFSNLTPKKTFEYDVSDTAYHPLFSRANTGISTLMSEVDDIVKFRITVTGTNIYARVDVVVRFQPALTDPCMMIWNENSNSGNNMGLYRFRIIRPKALNSDYAWFVEFNNYTVVTRHIKVEVYEDTEDISWVETHEGSSYNSGVQNVSTIDVMTYRGLIANQQWRFIAGYAASSTSASYIGSYLSTWLGGTHALAGEALTAYTLVIVSGQKIYKATNKNVPIDCDCGVSLNTNAVAANNAPSFNYITQKINWTTLTGDPALTKDTFARGDQMYLRCTLGQDGKIYPDGHLSNVKSAGYTWVHIGTAASATAINLDTCGKPFITLNNDGKVTHINGTAVMDSSMSKWGVVSQTQTWTQAADGGYDYTMSDLQYGWIPQANIDLYEAAGAVFNEQSGYFELNGLTDISYEEMGKIYRRGSLSQSPNTWKQWAQASVERTFLPAISNTAYLGGSGEVLNFGNSALLESCVFHKSTSQNSLGISVGNSASYFLFNSVRLKVVKTIRFDSNTSTALTNAFKNCYSLEDVFIIGIKFNISFGDSARLKVDSILYMITNEASTSAITITLHPTAYARAIADSDVQAALQAHTNVSLASA